jgi:serine/threonine protein kinase
MGAQATCRSCHKPLKRERPSGVCLTCEYRIRVGQIPAPSDTLGWGEVAPAADVPHAQTLPLGAALAATQPGLGEGGGGTLRTGRLGFDSLPLSLPYAPEEVLGTIDGYDLVAELGQGGMGVVYKAYSRRLGRFVALKLIRSGENATEIEVARFVNEAMLAAKLNHPNIVRIYDSGQAPDGRSFFVMEYVEGRNLGHYLQEGFAAEAAPQGRTVTGILGRTPPMAAAAPGGAADGKLTLHAALGILEKTARAVQYAHEQGVVHRDIKPDNILLDAALEPHVTDFGIAKGVREGSAELTVAGHVMGSPYYMSPEQANGEVLAIGPRSDVYSLGATLYHVLTGRTMFEGPNPMAVVVQVLSAEPVRPSVATRQGGRGPVPLDLETLCLKAVEKEAARRYGSAGELADEIRRYLDGEPILARPVGPVERLRKRLRKNRPLFVGTLLAASLILALAGAFSVSLFDNIQRSSDSLLELDRAQAMAQSQTLERAIRVNMLQGRADLVRELVIRLGQDKEVGELTVARTDKIPAYTDLKTRRQVEQRLSRPEVLAKIRKEQPEFLATIDELKRRAFPRIDERPRPTGLPVEVDDGTWREALQLRRPVTYLQEDARGRRWLTVLKPIETSPRCRVCHGGEEEYGEERVRAVLVVKRPLDRVEKVIAQNRESTLIIAASTVAVLLALALLFARIFGIGVGGRRFGAVE